MPFTPARALNETERLGSLRGRLVTLAGQPIVGARVWVESLDHPGQPGSAPEAISDSSGLFLMTALEPAYAAVVWGEAADHAADSLLGVSVFAGVTNELGDLALPPGVRVSGCFIDKEGTPVAGVAVTVRSGGGAKRVPCVGNTPREQCVLSDPAGRFVSEPIGVGSISILGYAAGWSLWTWSDRVRPGAPVHDLGEIVLGRALLLAGVVVGPDGSPIAGASVISGPGRPVVKTGEDGAFRTEADSDGRRAFHVRARGYRTLSRVVALHESAQRLELQPAVGLEGTVVDDQTGEPVEFESVVPGLVMRRPDGGEYGLSLGDRMPQWEQPQPGKFRTWIEAPGEYVLFSRASDGREGRVNLPPLTDVSLAEIEIRVKRASAPSQQEPCARILGRLLQEGRPVTAGWVAACWPAPDLGPRFGVLPALRGRAVPEPYHVGATASVAADGSFVLELASGQVQLVAVMPGAAPTLLAPREFAAGNHGLDIELLPGGEIVGTVEGVPATLTGEVWVVAFQGGVFQTVTRVRADGSFALQRLPPGNYGLKCGHEALDDPLSPGG